MTEEFWFGVKVGMVLGFVSCLIGSVIVVLPLLPK